MYRVPWFEAGNFTTVTMRWSTPEAEGYINLPTVKVALIIERDNVRHIIFGADRLEAMLRATAKLRIWLDD